MTKLLFLAGFILSSIASLYFLIFLLFGLMFVHEADTLGLDLFWGFGFLISVLVAIGCYVIPWRIGLAE
jgi:hypothetical protein